MILVLIHILNTYEQRLIVQRISKHVMGHCLSYVQLYFGEGCVKEVASKGFLVAQGI